MRLISSDEYNYKTMQLGKPVFDKQKRILLTAGRKIHPVYLNRIRQMEIRYLFVEDAESIGISMDEMLDVPTWIDAIDIIQKVYEAVSTKKELPIRELQKLVGKLIEEVKIRKLLILIPTSSLAEEFRFYAHLVNVTLLSLQLAKKLHYTQMQLNYLALGAILHDIGKVLPGKNGDHSINGFEYLRRIREVNLLAAHVAYQHHEAFDGSGVPRGMDGTEIHEFAQICAITNFYDHQLSDSKMPPHEVMEFIMTKSGTLFSPKMVQLFVQEVPSYIPGSKVILNNGRKAIVTKILANVQRPFIRYLDTEEEISLVDYNTLLITEVITG